MQDIPVEKAEPSGDQEVAYYLEAANGMTVRVPASKLDAWAAAQERLKNDPKAAELTEAEKELKEQLLRRIYGDETHTAYADDRHPMPHKTEQPAADPIVSHAANRSPLRIVISTIAVLVSIASIVLNIIQYRYAASFQSKLDSMYQKGNSEGYTQGLIIGKEEGYSTGVTAGYSQGYTKGFAEGDGSNYKEGYADGYCDALSEYEIKPENEIAILRILLKK